MIENSVLLRRMGESPWGVFGTLTIGEWSCKTLERPWEGNARNVSCIPSGRYELKRRPSPLISRLTQEQYQEEAEPGRRSEHKKATGDNSHSGKFRVGGCNISRRSFRHRRTVDGRFIPSVINGSK